MRPLALACGARECIAGNGPEMVPRYARVETRSYFFRIPRSNGMELDEAFRRYNEPSSPRVMGAPSFVSSAGYPSRDGSHHDDGVGTSSSLVDAPRRADSLSSRVSALISARNVLLCVVVVAAVAFMRARARPSSKADALTSHGSLSAEPPRDDPLFTAFEWVSVSKKK